MTAAFARPDRFFTTGRAQVVDEHDRALWDALVDQPRAGKGVRPLLLERVYTALGGQEPELAETVGGAVELLHTAFVIHDDVIDDDDHRRGRPNVRGVFTAGAMSAGVEAGRERRYGDSAAILAGDPGLTPGDAARARDLLVACSARQVVESHIEDLRTSARATARTLPPAATEAVRSMIELFVPSSDPIAGNAARATRHQSLGVA